MWRFLPVLFFFLLSSQIRLQACSCVYIETFCETIRYGADTLYHDLIIYGTVTKVQNDGMEVAVAERLYGTDNSPFIFVKRGNGAECGENTSRFRVGQQLILALGEAYYYNRPSEGDYSLSICGINWLEVENGLVKGPIAPGKVVLSYNDFKKSSTCSAFKFFEPTGPEDPEIKVFPNPVRDQLYVEVGESAGSFDYIISDICGRIIVRGIREEVEAESLITIELPGAQMSNGLYFLKILSGTKEKTFKIVVK